MDRRNFFKIVSSVSAGAASVACSSHKTDALIPLLVPDHEIVPGDEQWRPSVCTACGAGCGVIVRVMKGERVIERNGEKFREPIACVKKIEGNPLDSVSGGRLCARGHAELQSIYNPDRLRGPVRRTGDRGNGHFTPISWDEAIGAAAGKLAKTDPGRIIFLTGAPAGSRAFAIHNFLNAVGAPAAIRSSPASYAVERKAAEVVFGWKGLPRYDLGNARYALCVGADFLGGWVSPVYYARQYGHFRQGRPGLRGKLVQAESRMSLTAASADEWLPVRPGAEPQLLMAIAGLLIADKLTRNQAVTVEADLEDLIRKSGVPEKKLRRVARELGESEAPLVICGASVVQTNSLDTVTASHYLNVLLGNVGKPGGILPPIPLSDADVSSSNVLDSLKRAQVLLLDGENPVYTHAAAVGLMSPIDTVISFGGLMDDSTAYSDLILPDHHSLESESVVYPPVAGTSVAFAVATPVVRPLYDTRATTQTLSDIAQKMNIKYEAKSLQLEPAIVAQGGLWRDEPSESTAPIKANGKPSWSEASFAGSEREYPLHFQPYPSLQYHDGSGANLPWLQELPDPVSSFMWGLPLEIDPQTAAKLKIETGDWVQVKSPTGSLEAQVYVHPAALPGVISMGIGGGHLNSGRYGSGRGANPLSIVSPQWEQTTNSLAFGGTRVQVTRLEARPGDLIQFAPTDREQGPWGYR